MPRKPTKNTDTPRRTERDETILVEGQRLTEKVVNFFQDNRTRIVLGLVLIAIAAFLTLAYISFFVTGKADHSILEQTSEERRALRREIHNWVGLPGAYLSRFLIDGSFGLLSMVIINLILFYGLHLLEAVKIKPLRWFFCSVFWLLWGSVTLSFAQDMTGIDTFFRWGGAHGSWLAGWLVSYVQPMGTSLILLVTLIIFLVLSDKHFIPRMILAWRWVKSMMHRPKPKEEEPAANVPTEETTEPTETDETDKEDGNTVVVFTNTGTDEPEPDVILEDEPETTEATESTETTESTDEIQITYTPTADEEAVTEDEPEATAETEAEDPDLTINKPEDVEMSERDPDYLLQKLGPYDPRKELETFKFPPISLLKVYDNETAPIIDQAEQQSNANRIVTTLRNYGIEIESIKATVGPTVTLYEIVPKAGVRVSKIQSLENDIMLSLSAMGIRIIAPIPGKGTIGIEVPNEKPQVVSMHSVIASKRFQEEQKMRLPIAYGRTITNEVFMFDLAKTPHLLVAGATGTGKSVAINAIITSLLYKKHPAELKLVMVDPKMVEFAPYKPLIKHYLAAMPDTDPEQIVITDCDRVINTLNSLVIEMENRYKLLMDAGVRNLEDYNDKFIRRRLNPEKLVAGELHHRFLPYIVIIIDEYGDFIMQAGKQVETPIARITQKARAVGMHMILATQRPSVNIVTGVIKANIPTRMALRTQSVIDSRTVLDAKGAEQLIGRGDSLYAGNASITRVQCAFVDTPEVDAIVGHIAEQQHYFEPYQLPEYVGEGGEAEAVAPGSVDMKRLDPMFADVARYVVTKQEGSTSRLQRAFEIGYNRAGKLSDQLEAAGIVGPNKGPKGRDVLIQDLDQLDKLLQELEQK